MRRALPEKWTSFLVTQPESGMGYQRIDMEFADGSHIEDCVVFNAEEVEVPDDYANKAIKSIKLHTN